MNKSAMIKAMMASISEVLEQMFFLPIDMIEAGQNNSPGNSNSHKDIVVRVDFEGAPSGTFVLQIPSDVAESVAADFLGILPEELSIEQITGTVTEMVNMLAGNSLSKYNPELSFALKIPELVPTPKGNNDIMTNKETIDIDIEALDSHMMLHMIATPR